MEHIKYNMEHNKCRYDFKQYETIRSFGESVYTGKSFIVEAEEYQNNLIKNMVEYNNKSRPKNKEGKVKKRKFKYSL